LIAASSLVSRWRPLQGWLNVYFASLLPDNSKTGGNAHALPAIWENKAELTAIFERLDRDASDGRTISTTMVA
jgi:hypothetical protein